jgi:deoxyribodipyrimidine photolyase-related protein
MKTQRIIYDQLNTCYCYDDVDQYVFLHSSKSPQSPYGPLTLNPHSQQIEYDASIQFIHELTESSKSAQRQSVASYDQWLITYCQSHEIDTVVVMTPSEPTLLNHIISLQDKLATHQITLELRPNTQFLLDHHIFLTQWEKPPVMEVFYRWMRRNYDVLMDGDKPVWGTRNYDVDNRSFDKHFSEQWDKIVYPTSRSQALAILDQFITTKLDRFGELEDAMYQHNDTVYHSLLSTSINFGLLTPREVIQVVAQSDTAINNKEWFIRQILWWREYMYHRFWYYKDSIYTQNALGHARTLPEWFWWPEKSPLQMNCINHVLIMVKNTAYSHHITRLMIIGNFTLLMWYNPHEVNKRFWEMYADAFERVVTPNVLGMSQFADGGNLATKPYISSANYIHKMSDYCDSCYYDPKVKEWPRACPMNYLYWNFIDQHRDLFKRQPYIVSNLNKMDIEKMRQQAQEFINQVMSHTAAE